MRLASSRTMSAPIRRRNPFQQNLPRDDISLSQKSAPSGKPSVRRIFLAMRCGEVYAFEARAIDKASPAISARRPHRVGCLTPSATPVNETSAIAVRVVLSPRRANDVRRFCRRSRYRDDNLGRHIKTFNAVVSRVRAVVGPCRRRTDPNFNTLQRLTSLHMDASGLSIRNRMDLANFNGRNGDG
jgi:hypothetical protein